MLPRYTMEDLPEPLLAEIVKRITRASDLKSLSLVSKQLYIFEAEHRYAIRLGCGLNPATEALKSLFSRFPNLCKVEIDYSGWTSTHGKQLNNQGLAVLSSHYPLLSDLTLSFCSNIDDSGLAYLSRCTKLRSLRLNSAPAISWHGLFPVAVGCKHLSVLQLVDCIAISIEEWLVYLGRYGSLEELVVKDCKEISQYDLLKFGPGWVNLQKFEFEVNGNYWVSAARDPAYVAGYPYNYDICCENLKDLRLAHIITDKGIGLRFLLKKCKALETLYLEYVIGLDESEMTALFQSCSNLKHISLRLMPLYCFSDGCFDYRTPLTDDSLKSLALNCPMLQVVELTFTFCSSDATEIGFTQEGIVALIQSCPIRALVLNGASIFDDQGMKELSSCQFLETLELVDCKYITDAGMDFIIQASRLSTLTLRGCKRVTDNGIAALARSEKLESLTVIGCRGVSQEGVQVAAKTVHYSTKTESHGSLKGMKDLKMHPVSGSCEIKEQGVCVTLFFFLRMSGPEGTRHGHRWKRKKEEHRELRSKPMNWKEITKLGFLLLDPLIHPTYPLYRKVGSSIVRLQKIGTRDSLNCPFTEFRKGTPLQPFDW